MQNGGREGAGSPVGAGPGLPVARQVGLGEELAQQHAVRHVAEDRPLRRAVLKADAVAHLPRRQRATWAGLSREGRGPAPGQVVQGPQGRPPGPPPPSVPPELTSFPSFTPISRATRAATLMAATLLGWVQAIFRPFFV